MTLDVQSHSLHRRAIALSMCGLVGFSGFKGLHASPQSIATSMGHALAHRGPDDWGTWIDADAEIALVHRRLSIVDLSPAGHQPMQSASTRFVMVFNGEIYNHAELRADLEAEGHAPPWRGHSDTEVLLEAVEAWGLRRALERSVGMFALALVDRAERRLYLARDRIGEKPLYYGRIGHSFAFASEIKALTRHPSWVGEIDRNALALFMRYNNVPAPYSIYRDVRKLPQGTLLAFDCDSGRSTIEAYWNPAGIARDALDRPFRGSAQDAVHEIEALLLRSVKGQMVADVPLGAFLSGGLDSSTTVALMQSLSSRPVKTFSIGFHIKDYDEAPHARTIAHHLGTEHTELYVTEKDALDVIPKLPEIYCEPFADSSQIPTYLVSRLARQHVTVALSGDGGDEVFGGYVRHGVAHGLWRKLRRVPVSVRRAAATLVGSTPSARWDAFAGRWRIPVRRLGDKLQKSASVLSSKTDRELYGRLISHWHEPQRIVPGSVEPDAATWLDLGSPMRSMMLNDLVQYLPDDVLTKLDRAAMANSLETRVPMLDHRLIEFTTTLPDAVLRRDGKSKWLLRQVLARYVPPSLVERPKMGFGIPLDRWLRGELRDWGEELLSETRLKSDGFVEPMLVRRAWSDHLAGRQNLQHQLWCVLVFQAWLTATKTACTV